MSQRMNYHAASAAGVKALGAVVRICSPVGVPSRQVDLLFLIQHAPAKVGRDDVCAGYKQLFDAMNELFVFRREKDDWRVHRYFFSTKRQRP